MTVQIVGRVVFGADDRVADWVGQRVEGFERQETDRALGVINADGRLIAGVVYEKYNGVHCTVTIAATPGSRWAARETLRTLFFYPFVTLDCAAISALIPSTNLLSLNLCTALGFEGEALIRFAAPDGSTLVVMKMDRENCRWLTDGKRKIESTDAA